MDDYQKHRRLITTVEQYEDENSKTPTEGEQD
jgi:hypothetical protein